jgi:hypothetical protein
MKKSVLMRAAVYTAVLLGTSFPVLAQSWSLTGNAGTNSSTNFVGTTDNTALRFRTNNIHRMSVTSWKYGGLEVGSAALPSYINISSRDVVDTISPFNISCNILNQTWGNTAGRTMGRLMRFNQGPSQANGGVNFYDVGIGQDTCFFITNHSVPPAFGNGVIRKRMIVISPQDRVGINLAGDVIGNGAVPTANFHTNGTVRLQNLPSGAGDVLVIDSAGYVYRSFDSARAAQSTAMEELKKEVAELRSMVSAMKAGSISLITTEENQLFQNAPNPFNKTTTIKYTLPLSAGKAVLAITDLQGKTVQQYNLAGKNNQQVVISAGELPSGTYLYSLIVDGKTTDTKKMVLTR